MALCFIMLPVKGLLGKKDKSAATLGRVGECSPSSGLAPGACGHPQPPQAVTVFCCIAVP